MNAANKISSRLDAEMDISVHVPYGHHVKPDIVRLKDGKGYVATWQMQGVAFETAGVLVVNNRKIQLNSLYAALGGGSVAFWTHRVRSNFTDALDGTYGNSAASAFVNRYNERFTENSMMATKLFVTIVFKPDRSFDVGRRKKRTMKELKEQEREDLDELEGFCMQFESSMSTYDQKRLSIYEKENGHVYSQILRLYGFLVNGVDEEVPLRRSGIDRYLGSSRLFFGDKNGLVQISNVSTPGGKRYAGILDMQDYPDHTESGINNALFYEDFEFIETQSFATLNKREALSWLDLQSKRITASESGASVEIEEMEDITDQVRVGTIQLGEYHYSLVVFGDTLLSARKNMATAKTALQDSAGYKMSVVDVVPEAAWFAQLPGNFWLRPRKAVLTSRNYAGTAPFHNFPTGKRDRNPWGEAIALFKTPSLQPLYFNYHCTPAKSNSIGEKVPGNTSILGATGVGKTTLVAMLLTFSMKVKGLRAIFFDKDRGSEILIRWLGGKYEALKYGERTGFNPFQFESNNTNISFCKMLVAMLIKGTDDGSPDKLSAKEKKDINHAVDVVFNEMPFELRRLATVHQNLPNDGDNSLAERLARWVGYGEMAWVFDNATDTTDFSDNTLFGYDYTEFLDRPEVRTPIMAYLLHVTERLIDGKPFIYYMEEFWKPLLDEYFRDFALNKQKTIRKQNGLGVFITQSPSEILNSPIGHTMVEQSVTQIFLPNPKADKGQYVDGFKLTEDEFDIVSSLGEHSRQFLIKQDGNSTLASFDIGGMPDMINILSGSTDNVEILDVVRAEVGDSPEDWLPLFQQRISERNAEI